MSINTSKKDKDSGSSSLGFGLNSRATGTNGTAKKRKNVLDGSDDDSDDDDDSAAVADLSGREQVNRQITTEQEALRKRAQAAVAAIEDTSIYDYDNAYDAFKAHTTAETEKTDGDKDKKSKYIGDLLKAAKKRELERDAIHERQVSRMQAEEDKQADFIGKEKFITKAYKRKLAERQQWEAEEEEQRKKEEENDVSKKPSGTAFGNFYGNFTRNVAFGGQAAEQTKARSNNLIGCYDKPTALSDDTREEVDGLRFLNGFERSDQPEEENDKSSEAAQPPASTSNDATSTRGGKATPDSAQMSTRQIRERKVAEARVRYLQRQQQKSLQLAA
jgi:hypothetical protein